MVSMEVGCYSKTPSTQLFLQGLHGPCSGNRAKGARKERVCVLEDTGWLLLASSVTLAGSLLPGVALPLNCKKELVISTHFLEGQR